MAGKGATKITKEQHIETINLIVSDNDLPLEFKGFIDYDKSSSTGMVKINFFCKLCNDNITSMSIDNFKKNKKCSGCSSRTRKDRVLKPLSYYISKIDEMIDLKNLPYSYTVPLYYVGKKNTRIEFECNVHKTKFSMTIDNFLKERGCIECGKERSSKAKNKTIEEHISVFVEIHGDKYSYDNFTWNGVHGNSLFTCNIHNYTFEKTPCNFRKKREHCPLCNGEVDINTIPTEFYIQRIIKDGLVFCKLGISTDTHRRMVQQKWQSGAEHELIWKHTFPTRIEAMKLEKTLMESIDHGVVDSSVLPDGFTETFDEKYLDIVLEIVNNFK